MAAAATATAVADKPSCMDLVDEDARAHVKTLNIVAQCNLIGEKSLAFLIESAEQLNLRPYVESIMGTVNSRTHCIALDTEMKKDPKHTRKEYLEALLEEEISGTDVFSTEIRKCTDQIKALADYYPQRLKGSKDLDKTLGQLRYELVDLPFNGVQDLFISKLQNEVNEEVDECKKLVDDATLSAEFKVQKQKATLVKLYYIRALLFSVCCNMRIVEYCVAALLPIFCIQRATASLVALNSIRPSTVDEINDVVRMPWRHIEHVKVKDATRIPKDTKAFLFLEPKALVAKWQKIFASAETYLKQLQLMVVDMKIKSLESEQERQRFMLQQQKRASAYSASERKVDASNSIDYLGTLSGKNWTGSDAATAAVDGGPALINIVPLRMDNTLRMPMQMPYPFPQSIALV